MFEGQAAIRADRPAFLMEFLRNFYNYDVTGGKLVSDRVLEDNWNVAVGASAIGTVACVDCWIEDFRKDIAKNNVPTLILHGDADRILPPDATSRRQAKMIKNVKFVELPGGPHGVLWTHADDKRIGDFLACCGRTPLRARTRLLAHASFGLPRQLEERDALSRQRKRDDGPPLCHRHA